MIDLGWEGRSHRQAAALGLHQFHVTNLTWQGARRRHQLLAGGVWAQTAGVHAPTGDPLAAPPSFFDAPVDVRHGNCGAHLTAKTEPSAPLMPVVYISALQSAPGVTPMDLPVEPGEGLLQHPWHRPPDASGVPGDWLLQGTPLDLLVALLPCARRTIRASQLPSAAGNPFIRP
jgi:hypothetical protein